jgi:acyl dehydratase
MKMTEVSASLFELNKIFDFGSVSVSEQEIIDFATFFDPLDFHTKKEVAEKSMFGALVTSGPHIFNVFYKRNWVPLIGSTVLAGLELNNWKFLKPIYANMHVFGKVTIAEMTINKEQNKVAVKWHFDFTNEKGEYFQTLDMSVLHKMA